MQTLDNLSQAFVDSHAQDAAPLAESFPPDQSCDLLMRLPDAAAAILRYITAQFAGQYPARIPPGRAAAMLAALPLPTGAAILRRMEPARVAILIKMMDPKRAGPLGRLLQFPERTVGALVDPAAFTLPADITVQEAHDHVRRSAKDIRDHLYVVDRDENLVGVLNLRDFMLASPTDTIATIMRKEVLSLPESAPESQMMVGVNKEERALAGFLFSVRTRLPWLNTNRLPTFLAAAVVGLFEATIAKVTALAGLLPVVAGQSGNTGAQALAVTMRGLPCAKCACATGRGSCSRKPPQARSTAWRSVW